MSQIDFEKYSIGTIRKIKRKYTTATLSHETYSTNNAKANNLIQEELSDIVFVVFTGFGGLNVITGIHEIDPHDYSPNSETGTLRLLYHVINLINDKKLLNKSSVTGYYSSQIDDVLFALKPELYISLFPDLDIEYSAPLNYVKEHFNKENGKIFLYGYSMGGYVVNEFAKKLKYENIPVDVLFTVDAYNWFTGTGELTIPDNVKTNWNFYQTTPDEKTEARGTVNDAEDTGKTKIYNKIIEDTSHLDIDENTIPRIISTLKSKI